MTEKKPEKRCRKYDSYVMIVLAALLLWIGGKYDYSPQEAHHQLIVATPKVTSDALNKTVIFVVQHFHRGAFGLVINRPEENGAGFVGGPVEPEKVFALQSLDVKFAGTVPMEDIDLGVLEGKEAVDLLLAAKEKPKWYRVYHGYVGWGRRQLESEFKEGAWEIVEFNKPLLTETKPADMYSKANKLPMIRRTH